MTPTYTSWNDVITAPVDEPTRIRLLAQTCLAYSLSVPDYLFTERPGGVLPSGRPTRQVVKAAATALVNLADQGQSEFALPAQIIGNLYLHPDVQHDEEAGDVGASIGAARSARVSAETLHDLDIFAWCCDVEARRLRMANMHRNAITILEAGLAALREFLVEQRDTALTIVPTGLFSVPFDNLLIDDHHQLIDLAAVTVVGSLAVATALAALPPETTGTIDNLAVYDLHRLTAAEQELTALKAAVSPVQDLNSHAELDDRLTSPDPGRTLAMAVHGSHDDGGWGQTKLLPDGTTIRAVDVLRWNVPRHCVLASCHSTLTATDGADLGGFPIAMLLRGAQAVIGTTQVVDDTATATLMANYWQHIAAGEQPATALQHAKLDYLTTHPHERDNPANWAPLITYGHG